MALELVNVSKKFGDADILRDINLTINEGEFVAIVGFTGSGKTTLLKMMAGLLAPSSGEVLYRGVPVKGPDKRRGVVFQNYSLLPWFTVFQNIMLAVQEVYPEWSKKEKTDHVMKYIAMVNLSHAANKRPGELSGGMRQRVSLARTLSMNPDMLLMDEPLSALDAITRGSLQNEIVNIWEQNKTTALLITNDVDEGILMADRIIPLNPGPNATLGPVFSVNIERPRDKTTMNDNPHFKKVRNHIIEYLLDMGPGSSKTDTPTYFLPDLTPVLPGTRKPKSKAA